MGLKIVAALHIDGMTAVFRPRALTASLLLVAVLCPARASHALDPFCGLVVTENLTLTSDHSCSGHGLVVGSDKITIDLGGFTLSGDGGMDDAGIQLGNHTGVTIKNGTVRAFGDGIASPIGTTATKLKLSRVTVRIGDSSGLRRSDNPCSVNPLGGKGASERRQHP